MKHFREEIINWGDGFYSKGGLNWLKIILAFLVVGIILFVVVYSNCSASKSFGDCSKELSGSVFPLLVIICIIYALAAYALIACFILYIVAKGTKLDLDLALVIFVCLPGFLYFLFAPNFPFCRLPFMIGMACTIALMYFAFKIRK